MESNQPIYRAPSLPKLSRRNISSSVMTGAQIASSPRLKRSTFSFVNSEKRGGVGSSLRGETSFLDKALEGTNQLLANIQKQLASDFSGRLEEKRQSIQASKIKLYRERTGAKEKAIESARNFGAGFVKMFDVVTAPAKSIFQKILDFFSIILTGLIVNNAFKWLQNPANVEKIGQFFKFVADHWRELLALYAGYKIAKVVGLLARIINLFGKRPPGGGLGGGGVGNICNQLLNCFGNKAVVTNLAQWLLKNAIFIQGVKGLVAVRPQPQPSPKGVTPPPVTQPQRQPVTPSPIFDWNNQAAPTAQNSQLSNIWDQVRSLANDPEIQAILASSALLSLADGPFPVGDVGAVANLTRALPKLIQVMTRRGIAVAASKGGTISPVKKKKCTMCSMGFSTGGTVGGRGSGDVDSVPAMLAPGEEVIRASASMLFRPLLKDINNNAGRMWNTFSSAIEDLVVSNSTMQNALQILSQQLSIFKQQLDTFVNEEKEKNAEGGGIGRIPDRRNVNVTPQLRDRSVVTDFVDLPKKQSSIVPINLPPQTIPPTNLPKFSTENRGVDSEEPQISSVNMVNPYMELVPEILGIFV